MERKTMPILHPGKTARDKASGAPGRDATNSALRGDWSRETHRGRAKGVHFPIEVCNGRKTRALRSASKRIKKDSAIQSRGGK